MRFRVLKAVPLSALLFSLACVDQPTEPAVKANFGKGGGPPTADPCDTGDADKAASDYFLDNTQRQRVRARLSDLANDCDAGLIDAAEDKAWVEAFEIELALDPSNPQAGDPEAGDDFLNAVLRLAGLSCSPMGEPCNVPDAPNTLDFTDALDPSVEGAFAVRPIPLYDDMDNPLNDDLAVVSRHSDANASSRWAAEPNIANQPKGNDEFTSGTWTGTLANDPSILYGTPSGATGFDWLVFPPAAFTEEVLLTYCGIDNGTIVTNIGILTRNANGLQQAPWAGVFDGPRPPGWDENYDPAYCFAGYFTDLYASYAAPIETAVRLDDGPSRFLRLAGARFEQVAGWVGGLVEGLFEPRPLSAAFAVSPGPRGTGLSGGFSHFDQVVVQPNTAQLEFVTQPCDGRVNRELLSCDDEAIQVRAYILDEDGNEVPFERLQIGVVAKNNNGTYGLLDGGTVNDPVNLCLGEPIPYEPFSTDLENAKVPCAATTETSGVAVFSGLKIVSTSNNPNAANGGYELEAMAVGPDGTFGYTVAPATSDKFNIKK